MQGGTASAVARFWTLVRRVAGARIMILNLRDRSWVATGTMLIEGQKGLNIGFLMPTLREEMAAVEGLNPPAFAPEGGYRRAVWGLAARMARVEAERVFLLDTGDVMAIRVNRDGFALPGKATPDSLRAAVSAATEASRSVRYSLGKPTGNGWGPQHRLAALFGDDLSGKEIRITEDRWPASVPETAGFAEIDLAMTLVGRLAELDPAPQDRLQVLGSASQLLAMVTKETEGWLVRVQRSEMER